MNVLSHFAQCDKISNVQRAPENVGSVAQNQTNTLLFSARCSALRGDFVASIARRQAYASIAISPSRQEAQLMLTNSRDALRGQSRSPNMVPFKEIIRQF